MKTIVQSLGFNVQNLMNECSISSFAVFLSVGFQASMPFTKSKNFGFSYSSREGGVFEFVERN